MRHFYLIKAREEDEEEEGKEEDEEEEGKEEDARMGGRSNTNNSEEDEEADEVTNYTSTTNPIFDQAVENAKKTETEMEIWIANATNASVTFIDEVVSAIEDVATSGHFNVSSSSNSEETNEDSTTTVVPVVQELQNEEEKKFEILRNVPEFRYRSSGALGGASTSDFSKSSIPSASKSAMLLQNVNEYGRKDFFVFGTLSMAFCVAFFVAVVLRKHAQKFKVVAAGEETTSEEEKEEEEEAALMRNERGAIKYGSVV